MADGTTDEAELLAAVTELGTALRGLVDASVTTTVAAAELRAAAVIARQLTGRLSASRRTRHQLPALDDPVQFRRVYNPVSGVGSALAPPVQIRRVEGGVLAETTLGLPSLRAAVDQAVGRKVVVIGTIALAAAPEQPLVEARGIFLTPRPEWADEYFGSITDASGRHAAPGRPSDATAVVEGA